MNSAIEQAIDAYRESKRRVDETTQANLEARIAANNAQQDEFKARDLHAANASALEAAILGTD